MAIRFLFHGTVKDGQEDAFRDLAERSTALVRDEPGHTEHEWLLSDDGRFVTADTFADDAAVANHMDRVRAAGLIDDYMSAVDMESFQVFGPVSQSLRETFSGMGPVYYTLVSRR